MSLINNELLKNGANKIKIHIEEGKASPEKNFFKAFSDPATRYPGLSTKKTSIDASYHMMDPYHNGNSPQQYLN